MTLAELKTTIRELIAANSALLGYTDEMADGFVAAAVAGQNSILAKMSELIATAPDFESIPFAERFAWYASQTSAIESIIVGAEYREMVTAYVNSYRRLAQLTSEVIKKGLIDEAFATVPKEYIEFLIERDGAYFIDILGSEAVRKIDDVVFEMSIGGYSRGAMLGELKGAITGDYPWAGKRGLYEWHAGTYARTAANRNAQMYLNIQAEKAGIEKFLYVGPVDDKTRAFCLDLVGNVYTKDELESMDNGQTGMVMTERGGWNCRHQSDPVSDGLAAALSENADALADEFEAMANVA